MGIPPDFAADIRMVIQLEEQRQRDPRAIFPLIQVYKQMRERLRFNENPALYATLHYSWAMPIWTCRQGTGRPT